MASALTNPYCDLCKINQETKEAIVWCFECNEFLCTSCLRIHRVQGILKDHKPIKIEDYHKLKPTVTAIKCKCEQHGMKHDFYCVDHDIPICVKCVPEVHKMCSNIKSLTEVTDNIKESFLFKDLQERASDIQVIINNILDEMLRRQTKVSEETSQAISIIKATREAINQHLDRLEEEIIKEIRTQEKDIQDKNAKSFTTLQSIQAGANTAVDSLSAASTYASNFHTYCGIKHWNDEIQQLESELMLLQKNIQFFERFDVEVNHKLRDMKTEIMKFAFVKSKHTKPEVKVLKKERQGQKFVRTPEVKTDTTLSNARCFTLPDGKIMPARVYGCCFMQSGSMIFTDFHNGRLIHLDVEGKHIKDTHLSFHPFDVVEVDDHTVAVTSSVEDRKLVLVNINQGREVRTVYKGETCFGLSYKEGMLFVIGGRMDIMKIGLDGKVLSSIEVVEYANYCCINNEKLYYAALETATVYCCDLTGKFKWKYACQRGDWPCGITVDDKENVFVSCYKGNKVICIDKTGTESKVLLTANKQMDKPLAIAYNKQTNSLLVANECDGKCFLYKID